MQRTDAVQNPPSKTMVAVFCGIYSDWQMSGRACNWLLAGWAFFLASIPSSGLDASQLPEYQTTVWRVEEGLPQSTVTCMAQSAEGYLWLGTQNGLVRFDGVKFRVFDENNTPAFKNSRIVRLLCDDAGTLWIGTEHSGLVRFRDGQFTAYEVPSLGTTHDYARVFCDDLDGSLWQISCEWQLIKNSQGQFTVPSESWDLSSHEAHALTRDREGRIWVGTDRELAVLPAFLILCRCYLSRHAELSG